MGTVLLWALATAGLTYFITIHPWCKPLRERAAAYHRYLGELAGCAFCTGAWSGILMKWLLWDIEHRLIPVIFAGAMVSLLLVSFVKTKL